MEASLNSIELYNYTKILVTLRRWPDPTQPDLSHGLAGSTQFFKNFKKRKEKKNKEQLV